MMRRVMSALVALVLVIALGMAAGPRAMAQERLIRFGTGATLLEPYLMPQLAWATQYLAQRGIGFQYLALSTDEAVEAAIDGNRIDIGLLSVLGGHRSMSQGLRERFFLGNEMKDISVLVVKNDVTDVKTGLRGKRVGVQSRTSLSTVAGQYLLRKVADMEAGRDYTLVFMQGSDTRAAALEKGVLDASMLFAPIAAQLLDRAKGRFKIVGGLYDLLPPMLWEGFVGSENFLSNNRELAKEFIRADLFAVKKAYQANPTEMASEFRATLKGAQVYTPGSLESVMALFQRIKLWPIDGGVNRTFFDAMTQFLLEQKQISSSSMVSYERAVDVSLLGDALLEQK